MKEVQDTIQVGIANGTAIGISLVEANEYLTFISLCLAIAFSIYKFFKFEKKNKRMKKMICSLIYKLTNKTVCFNWCNKNICG